MDKYEEAFKRAHDRLRFTGVGGVQLPNPDLTSNPIDPIKVDPHRQLTTSQGWVMVGGPLVRNKKKSQSKVQVLGITQKMAVQKDIEEAEKKEEESKQKKIEESIRANAKKNNKGNKPSGN